MHWDEKVPKVIYGMNHFVNSSIYRGLPCAIDICAQRWCNGVMADLSHGIQAVKILNGGGYDKAVDAVLERKASVGEILARTSASMKK